MEGGEPITLNIYVVYYDKLIIPKSILGFSYIINLYLII